MRILYVATLSNTINAFLIEHIRMLCEKGHKVDVACRIEQQISEKLIEWGCSIHEISFSRKPCSRQNILAYKNFSQLAQQGNYDLVHTHTPVASVIVRLVCKKVPGITVFYTAHGFHFYKGAPLLNWFIYYPVERWLSKFTNTIITINREDYNRAKKHFKAKKVVWIPGVGVDTKKFSSAGIQDNVCSTKWNKSWENIALLSVGEINKNKNHLTVIKALKRLNRKDVEYVICGEGKGRKKLEKVIHRMNESLNIQFLGHCQNMETIYKTCDVFVFPSIREGLGIAAIEAMASGLPVIAADNRGTRDYLTNGVTGYVCNPRDSKAFAQSIEKLINDADLRKTMGTENRLIAERFSIERSLQALEDIYKDALSGGVQ